MSPSTHQSDSREFATEMKFLVSAAQAEAIRQWIAPRLDRDPNADAQGGYRVTSLYYDTPARDVFHRRGSYGRGKYRVRRYGDSATVFLERKMKRKDRVGKIRSAVTLDELAALDAAPRKGTPGYWFHRRLAARRLAPVCQISYRRSAWAALTAEGVIRLTIDSAIVAAPVSHTEFLPGGGVPVTGLNIVEIKFHRQLPALFRELVRTFALAPRAVSKYRLAASMLGLAHDASLDACRAS